MSGSITFPDKTSWHAAGWAYRNMLRDVCCELKSMRKAEVLYKELSSDTSDALLYGHIEMNEWDKKTQNLFYKAVQKAYETNLKEGPKGWSEPSKHSDYLDLFKKLNDKSKTLFLKRANRRDAQVVGWILILISLAILGKKWLLGIEPNPVSGYAKYTYVSNGDGEILAYIGLGIGLLMALLNSSFTALKKGVS